MKRESARPFTRNDIAPAALALLSLVLGIVIFGSFMRPYSMQVGYDEGYEAAGVERIIDGRGLPYVDAVSIRGPFLYWSQAIVHLVSGRFQWTGTRLLALLSCAAVVISCFFAGWAARWSLAGAVAGAVYVFVVATYYAPGGGIGLHAEPVAIAYLTTGLFLTAYGLYRARTPRRRTIFLAAGGVLVAVAGLTKQTIALCSIPMLFWVIARATVEVAQTFPDGRPRWRPVLMSWALPFAAGGLGLVALVLLRYALAGELGTFFFWSVGVGSKIYMAPYKDRVASMVGDWFIGDPWAILGASLALVIAVGASLSRVTELSLKGLLAGFGAAGFETGVGLTGVVLMFAAAMPLRIWPHYFVPVWAFLGLILGVLIERIAVRGAPSPRLGQAAVVLIVGSLLTVSAVNRISQLTREYASGAWHSPRPDPACAAIDRIAGPGREEIFIWGVAGDLYVTCQRRCSSMYTHTTLIMGMAPPFWNVDLARVPPGAREKLLSDLTTKPPKVIVDHAIDAAGTRMIDVPMYAAFVNQRYCQVQMVSDRKGRPLTLYARRDLEACRGR
jgi:hypothetical protein